MRHLKAKGDGIVPYRAGKIMYAVGCEDNAIRFVFSSERSNLDKVMRHYGDFLAKEGMTQPAEAKIVLRELLINAIDHGNKQSAGRLVRCHVEHLATSQLKLEVEDEGEGFPYWALKTDLPDNPQDISRRGYLLIKALSDEVQFNDRGNRVTVLIPLAADSKQ